MVKMRSIILVMVLAAAALPARADNELLDGSGPILHRAIPLTGLSTSLLLHDWEGADQFWKGAATTVVLTQGLKVVIDETRPNGHGNMSFPSGHTSCSFFGAAFIEQRYGWEYGLPAYLAAAYVGWSRIDDRAHYTHDVLAGAAIGVMSAYWFTSPYTKDIAVGPLVIDDSIGLGIRFEF